MAAKRGGGPGENKSSTGATENTAGAAATESKAMGSRLDDPEYTARLERGRHFDPGFPHPYGSNLPDLGRPAED